MCVSVNLNSVILYFIRAYIKKRKYTNVFVKNVNNKVSSNHFIKVKLAHDSGMIQVRKGRTKLYTGLRGNMEYDCATFKPTADKEKVYAGLRSNTEYDRTMSKAKTGGKDKLRHIRKRTDQCNTFHTAWKKRVQEKQPSVRREPGLIHPTLRNPVLYHCATVLIHKSKMMKVKYLTF